MKILLFPHSKKGKSLIEQFGDTWDIVEHRPNVQCLNNDAGFNIQPSNRPDKARWIHQNGDPNFQIVEVIK